MPLFSDLRIFSLTHSLINSELKWKPFEELMLNPLLATNSAYSKINRINLCSGSLFFVGTDIHIKTITFKNNKQMNTIEFLNYALEGLC